MPVAPELLAQNFSFFQAGIQPQPPTLTAAATVSPITTALTLVTGTTAIATITPPLVGTHMLAFQMATTNFSGFTTTGNIAVASSTNATTWNGKLVLFVYNPIAAVYYPLYPGTLGG